MTRRHDQGSLQKKEFFLVPQQFQRVSTSPSWQGHGSKLTGMLLDQYQRAYVLTNIRELTSWSTSMGQRGLRGNIWASETSKLTRSDIPPSTRPFFLILPKQFHQARTKHREIWAVLIQIIHSSRWHQTHDPPDSAFPALRLQVYSTLTGIPNILALFFHLIHCTKL